MSQINNLTWETLDMEGFEDREKPTGLAPFLSAGITEVPDKALMNDYREFLEWGAYAGARLAHVGADLLVAEQEERQAAARAAFLAKDTAKTVAAQKAAAAADPDAIAAASRVIELEAYKLHLARKLEEFDKGAQYCSRELSRRLARHDRENRDAKWGA